MAENVLEQTTISPASDDDVAYWRDLFGTDADNLLHAQGVRELLARLDLAESRLKEAEEALEEHRHQAIERGLRD